MYCWGLKDVQCWILSNSILKTLITKRTTLCTAAGEEFEQSIFNSEKQILQCTTAVSTSPIHFLEVRWNSPNCYNRKLTTEIFQMYPNSTVFRSFNGGILSSPPALHESSPALLLYSGMSLSHSCSSSCSLYLSISHNTSFSAVGLVACVDRLRWRLL